MRPFLSMIRDTWLMWLLYVAVGIFLTLFVDRIFLVSFPIYIFAFIYFALVRYDENGNLRED